jgi:hypothetical protein
MGAGIEGRRITFILNNRRVPCVWIGNKLPEQGTGGLEAHF